MGKILDQYEKMYNEVIHTSVEDTIKRTGERSALVVKPSVWMTMKYLEDNAVTPWSPNYRSFFNESMLRDPEFGQCLVDGLITMKRGVPDMPLPFPMSQKDLQEYFKAMDRNLSKNV